MSTTLKRSLALVLGAALIAVPVSMASAQVDTHADDYTGASTPSGDDPGSDGDGSDGTPYTTPAPSGDVPSDSSTDPTDGNQVVPCSTTDPCTPGVG